MSVEEFASNAVVLRLALTAGAVLLVLGVRRLLTRWIRHGDDILNEEQRKRLFYARSALNLLLALAILIIWLGQLQNLVLSLTAVAIAIVIATKELLMCLSGFLLRTGSRAFSVGDWIEVGGVRGEVADHNLLSTTLLEVHGAEGGHRYTGRSLVVPNSLFLTNLVRNENFAKNYAIHGFIVTVLPEIEPQAALAWLERETQAACTPFEEVSRRYNAMIDRKLGVDVPGPEPRVSLRTTDFANLQFEVLLFCPTREAADLERSLTAAFLEAVAKGAFEKPEKAEAGKKKA